MARSGAKQSRTRVNANASHPESQEHLSTNIVPGQSEEDLGGPEYDDYEPTNDSGKLSAGKGAKKTSNRVNARAKAAEIGHRLTKATWSEDSDYDDEDDVEYDEYDEDEYDDELEEGKLEAGKTLWHGKGSSHAESEDDIDEDEALPGGSRYHKGSRRIAVDGGRVTTNASNKLRQTREENYEFSSEYIDFLTEGETLSEEFKAKAQQIFESAVRNRVDEELNTLESLYEEAINEELDAYKEALAEKIENFLDYVTEEWLEENKIAVESGIKLEIAESFMSGIKSVFEENYIDVPEEKVDLLGEMADTLDEMEEKLNEQIERNISLRSEYNQLLKENIFNEVSDGLADSQKEKFAVLAESIEFGSERDYAEKLENIKQNYFSAPKQARLVEDTSPVVNNYLNESMSAYVQALSRYNK